MKNTKVALFDFDGVIADSENLRLDTYKQLFKDKFDIEIAIDKKFMVGNSLLNNVKSLLDQHNITFDIESLIKQRKLYLKSIINKISINKHIYQIILELYENHIPIHIVSNSSKDYMISVLNNNDCIKFYQSIVSGDDFINKKPSPDMYNQIIIENNYDKDKSFIFEDSLNGIRAANSSGCQSIGVIGTFSKSEISEAKYLLNTSKSDDINSIVNIILK